jgi:hypothetical protein
MNTKATQAYIAKLEQIAEKLAKLQELSDNNFDSDPGNIDWGHVGTISRLDSILSEALESVEIN